MTFSGLLLLALVGMFFFGAFIRKPLRCYTTMFIAAVCMLLWAWMFDSRSLAMLTLTCLFGLAVSAFGAFVRHDLSTVPTSEPQQH